MPHNRLELAQHFAGLGFKKGAEIGVYKGYYSKVLLDTIPGLNLLSIDPYHRQTIHVHVYPEAVELLKDYPGSTLLRGFSADVVKLVTDESLDFVYIDGDHNYDWIKNDIEQWSKKVRPGGIVSGHDYYRFKYSNQSDVIKAVDEYVLAHQLDLHITEWNRSSHKDDRQPSWWFVK